MHARQLVAVVTLTLVAACGGSQGTDDTTKESSAPPKPTAQTPEQLLEASVCGQVDGEKVAAALDREGVVDVGVSPALLGIPSYDTCTITVGDGDAASPVTFGWSIEPVSADEWDTIVKHEKATNGRYTEIEEIDVADGGYFRIPAVGVALVGDRVVRVSSAGGEATAEEVTKLLELVVPVAPKLEDAPLIQTLPACEAADAEAEAVLGAKATIRRDQLDGSGKPTCGWATPTAAVTVSSGRPVEGESIQDRIDMFGGKAVPGLGKEAGFFGGEDGQSVSFDPGDGTNVDVRVPALLPGDEASLVALAKKLADTY
jgi:hypothetical protein